MFILKKDSLSRTNSVYRLLRLQTESTRCIKINFALEYSCEDLTNVQGPFHSIRRNGILFKDFSKNNIMQFVNKAFNNSFELHKSNVFSTFYITPSIAK